MRNPNLCCLVELFVLFGWVEVDFKFEMNSYYLPKLDEWNCYLFIDPTHNLIWICLDLWILLLTINTRNLVSRLKMCETCVRTHVRNVRIEYQAINTRNLVSRLNCVRNWIVTKCAKTREMCVSWFHNSKNYKLPIISCLWTRF